MVSNVIAMVCWMVFLGAGLSSSDILTNALVVGDTASGTISVKLLHRDHVMSPLHDAKSITLADRIVKAVRRSHARRQRFEPMSKFSEQGLELSSYPPAVEAQVYAASGEYVMTGSLGTPSVNFVAIADTGSDLVWLQCKPCSDCYHQRDPLFDPTKSATFERLSCSSQFCKDLDIPQQTCSSGCSYLYEYGDGSYVRGVLASETAFWTTTDGRARSFPDLAFGCSFENGGNFGGADGLVGLGRGPLSLPSQIGSSVGKEFSYCLGDFVSATNQSSSLILGKDQKVETSGFKFTPLIFNNANPTFYYIHLKSIKVGGQRLNITAETFSLDSMGNGGIIVDSGTTITFLPKPAYDAILKHLLEIVAYDVVENTTMIGLDLCFDVSKVPVPKFPAVSFRFSGATLRLPPQNTFITFEYEGATLSCLALAAAQPGSLGIIGNYQQQNFLVIYDLERSLLGFKEQKCL